MNLPNKLTTLRIVLIPIFIVFFMLSLYIHGGSNLDICRLLSAIIFVVASITDYFDGKIARKYNLVTNYGKLMDPLADKMLVITALILLTESDEVNFLCTLIVVLRELTISAIRLIALEQGTVIAASYWGKYKTATQMISITLILFKVYMLGTIAYIIVYGLFFISTILVIISLVDYIIKNKKVFNG